MTPATRSPFLTGLRCRAWRKPTVINNVETLSNLPYLITMGADVWAKIGEESSPGPKLYGVSGHVNKPGVYELPMGTTLREIIYTHCGGIPNKKRFKAGQLGGPSGGCVPEQHLDIPVDYEAIAQVGAIMGSGGAIVMDEDTCMVDMARLFMDFVQDEYCGKCTPCREGTHWLYRLLHRMLNGEASPKDIALLQSASPSGT